jgi:hypothetical protein
MVARFMPLDLPLFDHKDTVLAKFDALAKKKFFFWHEVELTARDYDKPFQDANDWNDIAVNQFPEIINYVEMHFPFDHIVYAKLIRANKDVAPHVDNNFVDIPEKGGYQFNLITQEYLDHQLTTEPCGYRMILNGNRASLYLTETVYDTKRYCVVPDTTDCFVLKTNDSLHGVDRMEGDDSRLLLFVIGKLNKERHFRLLERSHDRYESYSRS